MVISPNSEILNLSEAIVHSPIDQVGTLADDWTAISKFSQDLFREILTTGEENVVISPLSAYYVLAMVALGAREETLYEFQTLLGYDPRELAPKLSALAQYLMYTGGSTVLNLAGSVWINERFPIASEFNQAMTYYFNSSANARNLMKQATKDEINDWIYKQTNGLVDEALEEVEIDEYTMMLLINTLYVSARWDRSFNPMGQFPSVFYLESGMPLETTFLSTNFTGLFASVTDYYEAVLLPYDDDRLGFFLVRPTDGTNVRDFAATHDLTTILNNLKDHSTVAVQMPKLDKEFDILMNDQLQAMGLNQVFDSNYSDLSGLIKETVDLLHLSEVRQTVRILVDAEGTEAAATTIGIPSMESYSPNPLDLIFNTAYLYAIFDLQTGIPLFMGVVDNPDL